MRISKKAKKILIILATVEGLLPSPFLIMIISLRIYVLVTSTVPKFVQDINNLVGLTNNKEPDAGCVYLSLYLIYVAGKVILAHTLWRNIQNKHRKSLFMMWIIETILWSCVGFLLLVPLIRNEVYETLIALLYTGLSSIFSCISIIYILNLNLCSSISNCNSKQNLPYRAIATTSKRSRNS